MNFGRRKTGLELELTNVTIMGQIGQEIKMGHMGRDTRLNFLQHGLFSKFCTVRGKLGLMLFSALPENSSYRPTCMLTVPRVRNSRHS